MSDIPFSKKYLHDLKALYRQHEDKCKIRFLFQHLCGLEHNTPKVWL